MQSTRMTWWHKNICRIHKGIRPTKTVLEDPVGLKEANCLKPAHSLTFEGFLTLGVVWEENNWFSLGVMFHAVWTISDPKI